MSFGLTPDQEAARRDLADAGLEVIKIELRRRANYAGANCPKLHAELTAMQRDAMARQDAARAVFKGDVVPVAQRKAA